MIDESSLPVGSCVRIISNPKMVMIAGYLPYDNQNKIMYDYIGIYVPIGIRLPKKDIKINKDYIYFNSGDIEKIVFMGFSDKKGDSYYKYLSQIKDKIDGSDLSKDKLKKIILESLQNIK